MKLTIIGSSDMWSKRNSASYLIDDDILVDIPNNTCRALRNLEYDPSSINYILITHFHGDHYFDIPFLLLSKTFSKKNENKKVNLYLHRRGIYKVAKVTRLAFPHSITIQTLLINNITRKKFMINDYLVNKVPVNHGFLKPAYGYIIKNDKYTIGFTGDTVLCKGVEYMASVCDILVCDTTRKEGNNKHMGIDNILYLRDKYKKCKFITSHMNEKTRTILMKKEQERIIVGEDGMVIDLK